MRDLPFLPRNHGIPLSDPEPDTNRSEAKHQAEKATTETNPNDGEHGETTVTQRRQRETIKPLVARERASIEPRQTSATAVGEKRRDKTREMVIRDIKGGETNEKAELIRDGAGEEIGVEVDDVEISAESELRRDWTGEEVRREVENGEIEEKGEGERDWAGDEVGGEV